MPRHAALVVLLAACKGPQAPRVPHVPSAASSTLAIGREGASLGGVAGDGTYTFASFAPAHGPVTANAAPAHGPVTANAAVAGAQGSAIEARRGADVAWRAELGGTAGELAVAGDLVAVAVAGTGAIDPQLAVRGDPGAYVVALERTSGKPRWRLAVDANEWALITSIAAIGSDVIVGGSFQGTLRAGSQLVTSAGDSDGFVARLTAAGQVAWLVRLGGAGADGVQGVAARGDRIAIAGTFTAGADLAGQPLSPYDERSPFGDAFIAELDGKGARRWHASLGGRADDTVAGVAIDSTGRIVVAASVREVVHVGSAHLVTQGSSDGLVAWFGEDGETGAAVLVGGLDFDGLRAIAAIDDRIVVGGFFSGAMKLGERTLTAGGGDDSFLAVLDSSGTITTGWHVGGAGREEITALSAIPGGFVAGVAHTATAAIEDETLPAPRDPLTGAALVVRGL